MDDDLDVHSAIINAGIEAIATVLEEFGEPQELAQIPGVHARAEDWERGREWVASCLNNPEQLYIESRLRAPTFAALVRWLKAE